MANTKATPQEEAVKTNAPEGEVVSKAEYDALVANYNKLVGAFNKLLKEYNDLHIQALLSESQE